MRANSEVGQRGYRPVGVRARPFLDRKRHRVPSKYHSRPHRPVERVEGHDVDRLGDCHLSPLFRVRGIIGIAPKSHRGKSGGIDREEVLESPASSEQALREAGFARPLPPHGIVALPRRQDGLHLVKAEEGLESPRIAT